MRHNNSGRKLKRTSSHRKATLAALCTAVIVHKRIKTTVAKAKETRMFVEKLSHGQRMPLQQKLLPIISIYQRGVKCLQLCGIGRQ